MNVNAATSDISAINSILAGQTEQPVIKADPLGREAFLTMLVAQLKHQDPLNPMDGTDFTAQLAQFSTLEQMFEVNDNLEEMKGTMGPDGNENLLDYIGKEVTVDNSKVNLIDGNASGGYYTLEALSSVVVNIFDGNGLQVASIIGGTKNAGTHAVEWNGTNDYGDMMPDGSYTYEVVAIDNNLGFLPVSTALTGIVSGVTYEMGTPYLVVGGQYVNPGSVVKVSQPGSSESVGF
ncbi:MAG: flagellar hook assembly protein FlgD [Deltaproteobacteria bacterium]|nr:flagellar hook assembly protein FlgD [Deltaproteobacteria bacterium]